MRTKGDKYIDRNLYVAGFGELGFDTKFGNPNPASIEDTGYIGVYNVTGTNIPYISASFYDNEAMEVINLPVPFETGFLIGDFSGIPDMYASYEVVALASESSVVRAFIPIVPELYAGTYDYVFQNLNSAVRIGESLIDTTYFSVISGTDSSDNPGLLFGDTIYIYDQNNDTNMTLAFVSNDFSSVNALHVNSGTGRLSYLSVSDSGLGTLGFDILGDISAAKSITAGDGVTTALSISAKPFGSSCNVGDGVRMRFRSGRQGGIFGTTVDTAYFESVMEDVGATTWESSFQGYVNNVSGSIQWLNVDADGTTIFPQVVRMVTGTNTNIETDEITIDLSVLEEGLAISAPILKPTAYSTLPETLPFPYALGIYDRFAIFAQGTFDNPEILFAYNDFSSSASIGADLTNSYLWANWDWCPQEDDTYSLGASDLRWIDGWFSGDVYGNSDLYVKHAVYSDSTTQTITSTTVPWAITLGTVEHQHGITLGKTGTVTISNASPAVISWAGHGLYVDSPVVFSTDGALPSGLTAGTKYYVISAGFGADAFQVSATPQGAAINTTTDGSGTHAATNRSIVEVEDAGCHGFIFSTLCTSTVSGTDIDIWFRKNGTNMDRTNTRVQIPNNNSTLCAVADVSVDLSAGDKIEMFWVASSTNANLLAVAAQSNPTRPATPSTILTIKKISK